jgi:hypothetical protein
MVSSELSGNLVDICPVGALTNGVKLFILYFEFMLNRFFFKTNSLMRILADLGNLKDIILLMF